MVNTRNRNINSENNATNNNAENNNAANPPSTLEQVLMMQAQMPNHTADYGQHAECSTPSIAAKR
jgi:hypothetical protein